MTVELTNEQRKQRVIAKGSDHLNNVYSRSERPTDIGYENTYRDTKCPEGFEYVLVGKATVLLEDWDTTQPLVGSVMSLMTVTEGRIPSGSMINVIRKGNFMYRGTIRTIRENKNTKLREAQVGQTVGISIIDYNNIRKGDIVEAYILKKQTDAVFL